MNKALLLDNIKNHNEYPDYLDWMSKINGHAGDREWVKRALTPDRLIGGYCEDFAAYFCYKYGIEMYFLNDVHDIMCIDGKYYDGWNVEGVDSLSDLEYVKRYMKTWSEDQLQSTLKVDEEWKNYNVFVKNFSTILKQGA